MKKILALLAVLAITGAGCITISEQTTTINESTNDSVNSVESTASAVIEETTTDSVDTQINNDDPEEITTEIIDENHEMKIACKETAGIYDDDARTCTCPDNDTFNNVTGECLTVDNLPDGIRGAQLAEDTTEQESTNDTTPNESPAETEN